MHTLQLKLVNCEPQFCTKGSLAKKAKTFRIDFRKELKIIAPLMLVSMMFRQVFTV